MPNSYNNLKGIVQITQNRRYLLNMKQNEATY